MNLRLKLSEVKARRIRVSQSALVTIEPMRDSGWSPLVIAPNAETAARAKQGLSLVEWLRGGIEIVQQNLLVHGAVLFRGFDVDSPEKFAEATRAVTPDLLAYKERSTPRTEIGGRIYTATEYPADKRIPPHNESSYSHEFPRKLWFFCLQPAGEGGETPIADSREVFRLLDSSLKERFRSKGVMYVRNYGEGIDLPWQTAFQTTERSSAEDYCRRSGIEFEWRDGNRLRTRQVRPAIISHPVTDEPVWFNQAHLFHVSSLDPIIREALTSVSREEDLPRNAYYGDGSPIETSVLDEIGGAYDSAQISFQWASGDVLLVDNILTAHGRAAFTGPRKVLVAMAELSSSIE